MTFNHLEMVKYIGFGLDPLGIIGMIRYWGEGPDDYYTFVKSEKGYYCLLPKDVYRWLDETVKVLDDTTKKQEG